ncbi:MAG: aminoglycoside phosphotransferase family protein [Cyclobacteriaceae bacterium]|nr:aminoglycoside phosphotransferase family protein [Cyclobacteriaceae bacterium]
MLTKIFTSFGLNPADFKADPITAGYINQTYKLSGKQAYVLQRVNKNVFTRPELIAGNLRIASDYLSRHYSDYVFLSAVKTPAGQEMVYDEEGFPWRLFPFIENSITINKVDTEEEAYNAASGFAQLTANLSGCDATVFKPTIDRFHDLAWRYAQFETALIRATYERKQEAQEAIENCQHFSYLVTEYNELIASKKLQLRITHNDTKINNILFDAKTRKAICVIDLDTLMPGYFIYDVGDMVRTFVSPVDEEEKDLTKVQFREEIYTALVQGYLSQMGDKLNDTEKTLFPFAGMMMTYIMALRMLADFLNGNIYYQIKYPDHNLVRARNQLKLLSLLEKQT